MTLDIVGIIAAIPVAIQAYTSIKDLLNSAREDLEKPDADWCTYINTLHGFKISWPSQRWNLAEGGNVGNNLYMPASITTTLSFPVTLPNPYSPGQVWAVVPSVIVNVDLHGSVSMEKYADACVEQKMRQIEDNSAIFAGRVVYVGNENYSHFSLLDITRVSRSKNKMISITGNIVEPSLNFDIVFEDLIKITSIMSLLRK